MSSTSSVCSSNDADFIIGNENNRLSPTIRRDVEKFSVFIGRLRTALDVNTNIADGESQCVAVHSALEMVSDAVRDLFKHSQFKTNNIILPSLQLVQSIKDLKFDSSLIDTARVHGLIDHLEAAVLNTIINKHYVAPAFSGRYSTLGRPRQKQSDSGFPSSRTLTLQRRHSAYQNDCNNEVENTSSSSQVMEIDKILFARQDGVEIAFERTKAWSLYCKDLLSYIRARLQLEQDHAKRVNALVENSRKDIAKPYMGLREVWEDSFGCDTELMTRTRETAEHLKDRVVEALDCRRKEHDAQRTTLKMEWNKLNKAMHDCEDALEKSRAALRSREEAVRKAKDALMRTESLGQNGNIDVVKKKREMEKKKRTEEEAIAKREEAEKQVQILTLELRKKRKDVEKAKERTIEKLRELVFQCDQTTKACSSHYFKALATLWVKLPGTYQELSDATRDFEPGSSYMTYLQNLPNRAASNSSLLRSDRSVDEGVSLDSSSLTSLRRNALNPDDEGTLPDTKRHKKTSTAGRLFDSYELSDAALSHCVQRTVQPSKCSHCDRISIVFTVQCIDCQQSWHRNCFPKVNIPCGPASRSSSIDRRMSIFGVPLKGQLDHQKRAVPMILEATIDELQKRGLRLKGIYRTCGVKSKIEELCEMFEKMNSDEQIDLSQVHPMNLASVVKLYLRKLPEPLLTFDLLNEWIEIGKISSTEEECVVIERLQNAVHRLPSHNYLTLKHLIMHLNRVTWFEEVNLMGCSNMAVVIAPSLIWPPSTSDHTSYLIQAQSTNNAVQALIKYAYQVFDVDRSSDWSDFFSRYSIEEPVKEEDPGNESDIEDDDGGDLDYEPVFLPQPPTPDLLKTTRKPQDVQDTMWQSSPEEKPRRVERPRIRDKRRSYTTSIIISPHIERPTLHNIRQKSVDDQSPVAVCSGDVTVDIAQNQFFIDSSSEILDKPPLRRRSSHHKDYSRVECGSSSSYGSDCTRESPRDLFPGDNDVSYV